MLLPVKNGIVCVVDVNQTTGFKLGLSVQVSEYACVRPLLSMKGLLAVRTRKRNLQMALL